MVLPEEEEVTIKVELGRRGFSIMNNTLAACFIMSGPD
jgi:hypothetical protein